jgi:hypothetical protein
MNKNEFIDFIKTVKSLNIDDFIDRILREETAEQPETSKKTKIGLKDGYNDKVKEFDISTDEGITGALQHMHGVNTSINAADYGSNVSQRELDAQKHNNQFYDQLLDLAKQRKLKIKYSGIGGDYVYDYGR